MWNGSELQDAQVVSLSTHSNFLVKRFDILLQHNLTQATKPGYPELRVSVAKKRHLKYTARALFATSCHDGGKCLEEVSSQACPSTLHSLLFPVRNLTRTGSGPNYRSSNAKYNA